MIVVSGRGMPPSLNSLVDAYIQKPLSMAQINDCNQSIGSAEVKRVKRAVAALVVNYAAQLYPEHLKRPGGLLGPFLSLLRSQLLQSSTNPAIELAADAIRSP